MLPFQTVKRPMMFLLVVALSVSCSPRREISVYKQAHDSCFAVWERQYGKEAEMTDLHREQTKRLCDIEGRAAETKAGLLK